MKNILKKLLIPTILSMTFLLLPTGLLGADNFLLDTTDHYSYLKGYENGNVYPDRPITRSETVSLLARILKEKPEEGKVYPSNYSDVSQNAWYYNAIGYMTSLNILAGYEDNTFRPNNNITRGEFASIIAKLDVASDPTVNAPFSDVPENHWAIKSITIAKEKGWISGYPNNTFRPEASITRAEVITVTTTMMKHTVNKKEADAFEDKGFLDLKKSHWAYYSIMDATTGGYYYDIPVLMYHFLASKEQCEPGGIYYGNGSILSVDAFEEQLQFLRKNNNSTLTVNELLAYLKAGKMPPKNTVILIFDDGYISDYTKAVPILEKYGYSASFAPIVKYSEVASDPTAIPDWNFPHTDFKQLKSMSQTPGIQIGSHSYSGHGTININSQGKTAYFFMSQQYLPEVNRMESESEYNARINYDLQTSKSVLENKLSTEVTFFIYPYGNVNDKVINAVKKQGFQCGFAIGNKPLSLKDNLYSLPRFAIKQQTTFEEFKKIITGKQSDPNPNDEEIDIPLH